MANKKAVSNQAQGNRKRPRPAASGDQTTDGTKHIFPFLELPAELRTTILQYIAQNYGTALLNRRSRGELSTVDAIGLANKQLREEYVAVLYSCAPTVLVHVLDFDFRHIVTFFNKLRASEVRELPTKSALLGTQKKNVASSAKDNEKAEKILIDLTCEQRIFKAILDFTPTCTSNPPFLLRWLGRLDAKSKTGHDTPFEYQARSRKVVLLWRPRAEWTSMWHLCPLTPRAREEIAKIEKALGSVAGKTENWKHYEYRYDEHPSDDNYVSDATESEDESNDEGEETMGDFLRSLAK